MHSLIPSKLDEFCYSCLGFQFFSVDVEMDFHSMKRRDLQALCKKHTIPANLSNNEMANRLAEILKENKEEPLAQVQQNCQDENVNGTEPIDVAVHKKVKKVRFSPESELITFTRPRDPKRSKRNSVSNRSSRSAVETDDSGEINNENVGRVTRSKELKHTEGKENEKKRGRNGVMCQDPKNAVASIESIDSSQLGEGDVNSPRLVTRLRGRVVVEAVKNKSKPERKRAKTDAEGDKDALNNAGDDNLNEKIVGFPGRVTRRGQKLMEDAISKEETRLSGKLRAEAAKHEKKQEKERENNDYARDQNALDNVDDDKLNKKMVNNPTRHKRSRGQKLMEDALRKGETGGNVVGNNENSCLISTEIGDEKGGDSRNFTSMQKKSEVGQEVLENQKIAEVPPHVLRRSRRNANKIGDSEILNVDTKENEKGVIKAFKETPKVTADGSRMDAENTGDKIDLKESAAVQDEEHSKLDERRSNRRRKDGTQLQEEKEQADLQSETEKRLQLGTSCEVSKDDDIKGPHATKVMRRSRRNTLGFKPISNKEKLNIDAAAENVAIEKHSSKPCLVEMGNPVQKNTRRSTRNASKHKSSEISQEFDGDYILQPENEAKKQKKVLVVEDVITNNEPNSLTGSMRKVTDKRKQPCRVDVTSQGVFPETEDSSFVDAQLPVPQVAESIEDPDLNSGTNANNIICDVGLTSSRSPSKMKDVAVADGDGSVAPDMKLINRDEFANSSEIAVPGTADFKVDHTDKNVPEPQDFCLAEDVSCNETTDSHVFPEGTTVPGNVSFSETGPSDGSLLLPYQTDCNTDLKATEGEEDKHAYSRLVEVDHVHEASGISVPKNLVSIDTELVKMPALSIDDQHNDVDPLESSNNSCESDDNEKILKAREAVSFEPCERHSVPANSKSALQLKDQSSSKLNIIQEDDNIAEGKETTDGGYLEDSRNGTAEDDVFCVSYLFEGDISTGLSPQDRGLEAEYSIAKFNVEGMHDDSLAEAPKTIVNSSGVNLDHPEDQIVERDETCINKSMHSESAKTDGSSEDHRSNCSDDGNGEFMSLLFDAERTSNPSGDGGTFSAKNSVKGSNQQGSSILPEIIPSQSNNVSGSQGKEVGSSVGETNEGKEDAICHSNLPGEGMPTVKSINDGECEVPNQADEHVHPKSTLVSPIAAAYTAHDQEVWTRNGYTNSTSKTNSEGKSRQLVQVSDTNNDGMDANRDKDMEDLISACATDVTSVSIPKVESESDSKWECDKVEETENECKGQLAKHGLRYAGEETGDKETSQSWTEIDLNDLFGTTEDDVTSTQLIHTPERPEIANLTMSVQKSTVSSMGSLAKTDNEMEGEQGIESAETTNAGDSVGLEESQLKWLFATPCNVDETSARDKELDRTAVSLKVIPETMMENIVAQTQLDAEMGDNKHEFENSFFIESPLLDSSDGATYTGLKESVELVNSCTAKVPSTAECKVCEASEEQTENACGSAEYTCTVKVPSEAEYEIVSEEFKEQMTESSYECREENTCTPKVVSEAEQNVSLASEEQLTNNICECREETKPSKVENMVFVNTYTSSIHIETGDEDEVYEASEAHLAKNTGEGSEENLSNTGVLSEVQYNGQGASEEPLPGNTCECREETEFSEVEGMELVNICATEVPQGGSEGQPTDEESEFREETQLNAVESVGSENVCNSEVSPEVEYNDVVSESSREDLSKNTWESSREEAHTIAENEEDQLFTIGQCSLYEEATITDSELREQVNRDSSELGEPQVRLEMLMDAEYLGSLSCGNAVSAEYLGSLSCGNAVSAEFNRESEQRSEAALELSNADFQKCKVPESSLHFNACNADDNILRETSVDDYNGLVDAQSLASFSVGTYLKDKGTLSSTFSMVASPENDKCIGDATNLSKEDADGSLRSPDISDELHTNGEVAIDKTTDSYTPGLEADMSSNNLEFHSTCKETKENGIITQDALNMAPVAGSNSSVCVVQSDDGFSSLAMHLHPGDIENDSLSKPLAELPFFNSETDQETDAEDVKEHLTPTIDQLSISEHHPEAGREELSNNVHSISNLLASGCYETLKASDIAGTVKEYTDSESSLAADLDDSCPSIHIDALIPTDKRTSESASLVEYQGDANQTITNSDPDMVKPSIETGCQEPKDSAFEAVKSPSSISSLQEGSADEAKLEMDPQDSRRSSPKQFYSTAKKTMRTILIHGTPQKQLTAADMKENAPSHKISNMSDFTTVRPKRKALQDVKLN